MLQHIINNSDQKHGNISAAAANYWRNWNFQMSSHLRKKRGGKKRGEKNPKGMVCWGQVTLQSHGIIPKDTERAGGKTISVQHLGKMRGKNPRSA